MNDKVYFSFSELEAGDFFIIKAANDLIKALEEKDEDS